MLDEMPKWVESDEDDNEGARMKDRKKEPALSLIQGLQPSEGALSSLMTKVRKVVNFLIGAAITAAILFIGVIGTLCYQWFYSQNDFSEAKAQFEQSGHADEGGRLAELGKVCRNGSATPIACKALYFGNILPDKKEKRLE